MERDTANRDRTQSALDARKDTRGTMDMLEDDQMENVDAGVHTELWGVQEYHGDDEPEETNPEWNNKECHTVPRSRKWSEGNKDDRIAMN